MPDYHRVYIPGGIYFFTVVTFHRLSFLTLKDVRRTLQNTWCKVQQKRPFQLIALCLLPDHLHCMWKLPENDYDYSTRWQKIKDGFSQTIDRSVLPSAEATASRKLKSEASIWQRRFWEHTIRNQSDYNKHIDYIHYNPVKHGYVQK
ncbi:transposase, partial [bacterium]|nr:transposase [bacterium]